MRRISLIAWLIGCSLPFGISGCAKDTGDIANQPKPDLNRQYPGRPDPTKYINGTVNKRTSKGAGD